MHLVTVVNDFDMEMNCGTSGGGGGLLFIFQTGFVRTLWKNILQRCLYLFANSLLIRTL